MASEISATNVKLLGGANLKGKKERYNRQSCACFYLSLLDVNEILNLGSVI